MSAALIALVGIIYACISIEQGMKGNWPMCVVFAGYAASNVGLWELAK